MSVDARSYAFFRVVEVHPPKIVEPDYAVEILPGLFISFGSRHIIAGSKRMAGVDTHADAAFIFHSVDYGGKMFESISQIGALTGGGFNHRAYSFGLVKRHVERVDDAGDAFFL